MKTEVDQKSVPVTNDLSNDLSNLLNIISDNGEKMTPFMKLFWPKGKGQLFILKIGKRKPLKK